MANTEDAAASWATKDDPDFLRSPTYKAMDRAQRALDGYNTAVFTMWYVSGDKSSTRYALPPNGITFDLVGPDQVPIGFFASREKGLKFQFHQSTPGAYREASFEAFAEYAEGWREIAIKKGFQQAPDAQRESLRWWRHAIASVEQAARQGITQDAFAARMRPRPSPP